uniref:Phenylalanine--tRNA ligase beta subunit n=1 Tax=Amicula sp. isolate GU52X-4 cfCalB7 TaxID=3003489 RepID=A0A9E8Z0R1_9STRA|nr:phenylalanine tRNA synthetase [Amicula sp. isolate GU52X-4 cfCalB7]
MQISLKWINELVNLKTTTLDDLIEKLTLGGFEVEEILEFEINNQKQFALEISTTANRSDSLSIQGISIEIAALFNKPSKISTYSLKTLGWQKTLQNFSKPMLTKETCSILLSVIIENLTNFSTPKWIKEKLISSGITPLNNLSDFQNFILLETGYPFEFYDFNKIHSKVKSLDFNLSISQAKDNQEFLAANGLKYNLTDSILLLKANEIPISLAGIIEGNDFTYSENTKSLLIEGSIFNAAKIRQQSRNLGLRTDRSARYEKSLTNTYLIESLYRLISLLRISNPNLVCKLHTIHQITAQPPKSILLKYQTINEILGPINKSIEDNSSYIDPMIISTYLDRLNFKFLYNNSELTWDVEIPASRVNDLTREIDLIEEVGRLHGFNAFLTNLPKLKTIGTEDYSYQTRKKLTSCLINLGLNELIHYSLVNQETFLENEIQLTNPLLSDCSNLRISLLPNLLKTVQENLKQGNLPIEGFEYGHVFSGIIPTDFKEKENVAGIFGGIKTKLVWSDSAHTLTWFEAKGKIEQLFKQLNLVTHWKNKSSTKFDNIIHPYRHAEISLINKKMLGIFGQINPILANQLAISTETYLFEFDVNLLQSQLEINKLAIYKEYSLYPKIIKDLSFIIKRNIELKKIQETIFYNGTKFLSTINLLDEYKGQTIPENHVSLCLQLVFQSNEKTLQNKEIDTIVDNLQSILIQKFNVIIRK